ncbi:MAG: two-component regulator propeller domain-containing protein [Bacteroidota bacterium]
MVSYLQKTLLLFLFLSNSVFCFSQQFTIYNASNSPLTDNTVRCVAVDTTNVLWVGTDNGLCRFDGAGWVTFTPLNSQLSDYYIRCLTIDSLNRVWVGTLGSGIFIYDGVSWQNINTSNSGISSNGIREIDFDPEGNLWVACAYGLNYFDGTIWTAWDYTTGFFTNNMSSIAFGPNKEKHIGTLNGGLHILDSLNNITYYTHYNSGLPDNTAYKVEFDSNGNLWMATPSAGLLVHLTGDNWLWYSQANFLFPTNSTSYLIIDGNLKYITTYDKGLIIFDGTNSVVYNTSNSAMPDNFLHCVVKDKNGILWMGSDQQGLIRLDVALGNDEILPADAVNIYPNPVSKESERFRVSGLQQNGRWNIFDVSGKIIASGTVGAGQEISAGRLVPGYYIFSALSSDKNIILPFIVR